MEKGTECMTQKQTGTMGRGKAMGKERFIRIKYA